MAALFERAIAARDGEARTRLGPHTAQELATRAVEYLRINEVLDDRWVATQNLSQHAGELKRLYEESVREARRLGDGWTRQQNRIHELEREKNSVWDEAQRLARGWETQTARIAELESVLRELWDERESVRRHIIFRLLRKVGMAPEAPQETNRT